MPNVKIRTPAEGYTYTCDSASYLTIGAWLTEWVARFSNNASPAFKPDFEVTIYPLPHEYDQQGMPPREGHILNYSEVQAILNLGHDISEPLITPYVMTWDNEDGGFIITSKTTGESRKVGQE